jgi:O-antigen ligase
MVRDDLRGLRRCRLFRRPNPGSLGEEGCLFHRPDIDIHQRNTAAVYFGSCVILWLLILLDRLRRNLPPHIVPSLALLIRPLRRLQRAVVIEFGALFACLIAMFLTGSRAGIMLSPLATLMALGLFALKSIRSAADRCGSCWRLCVVLILTQVLGAGVLGRFDSEGFASGGRAETYRSTLAIIGDHPWLGTGLGTFAFVFPAYRSNAWTSLGHVGSSPQYTS